MKNLIFLFLVFPLFSISQISSWRNNSQNNTTSSSSSSSKSNVPQVSESSVSSWRNSQPSQFNRPPQRPNQTIIYQDPIFNGWNRWNVWGAPSWGWNSWYPMYYFNDFGYRQPARVYILENGKRDTIKGKKPIVSFGLHHTTNSQMGVFFTVGNKGYFVVDFNTTYKRDRSTYFPYGTINLVDFPLISDLVKQNSFYVGVGKRLGRVGVHGMVGFANERVLYRGKDDLGEITFPKSSNQFISFKLGAMKDFGSLTLKLDCDPVIGYGQMGVGVNF